MKEHFLCYRRQQQQYHRTTILYPGLGHAIRSFQELHNFCLRDCAYTLNDGRIASAIHESGRNGMQNTAVNSQVWLTIQLS
jgi:hypothetical protein